MPALPSIGFFDSGWGGLSIMKAARHELPQENFCYVADCGNAPYGDRTHEFIVNRAVKITDFLFREQHVKAVVISCNTATAEAAEVLRARYPEAVIVGVEPAVKPACELSKTKKIGVIATTRTINSKRYRDLLTRYAAQCRVFSQGCPGLMECVESGQFHSPYTVSLLKKYLQPMKAQGIDALVLGCTHYPFLSEAIEELMGPEVMLLEPGAAVARHLKGCLKDKGLLNPQESPDGRDSFYVSGLSAQKTLVAQRLCTSARCFFELTV